MTLLPYVHQEGASLEEVLLTLVGGFEYEEIIAFKLDELFVWTLLLMSYLRCVSIAMQEEYDGRCKDTLYRFSSYLSVESDVRSCLFFRRILASGKQKRGCLDG